MLNGDTAFSSVPEWVPWLLPAAALGILLSFFAFSMSEAAAPAATKGPLPPGTLIDAVTRRPISRAFRLADKEFRMGEVFRQRRQYVEAIGFYRDALRIDPTHLEAHDRTGFCLWKQKDLAGAEQAFNQALKLDSGFFRSHFYLGRVFRDTGRWKEALAEMARAWSQSPKRDFMVGYEYAQLLFQLGMFPEALDLLGELRTRFPSNAQAETLRVRIMQAQNRQ